MSTPGSLEVSDAKYSQLLQNLFALGAVPGHVGDLEEHVQLLSLRTSSPRQIIGLIRPIHTWSR
jgi:hypothetical protein